MPNATNLPIVIRTADRASVERGFWRKLKAAARHIPFAEDAVAAYFCTFDPATPMRVRAVLFAALAYFILPTDLIPDFLPVLGFTDDAAVLAATLQLSAAHMRPEHRAAACKALTDLDPSRS
jgi:uncharacterized membrane protein YkvA (DUF1232 family)